MQKAKAHSGFTLLELIVAIAILAIGLGVGITLIGTAITSNNRNKLDTTATLLAQNVLEMFLAQSANSNTNLTMTDCQGNSFTLNPTGSSGGTGAAVLSNGSIDFSTAPSPSTGYNMNYIVCKATGDTVTYDVRWRVVTGSTGQGYTYTKKFIVAARPKGAAATTNNVLKLFAQPVTITGVAGCTSTIGGC
jgi:prepilin-type N-terminal cleavage/methylation domain-containing protein